MFLAPWFALAGVIAALGAVIIHLLNRHRYKLVHWAAMDFLREAIFRNRRIMRLRDLLLLALRVLCLLLFGFAMARPFVGGSQGRIDPNQPVHAVMLVDNSLSMSHQRFDGEPLLAEAKAKARELIEKLPRGSRISVLPTCGSAGGFSYEAYYAKDDALEALRRIEPVDRATLARETIDLALEACRRVPDMSAKRIYLMTDQQVADWPSESLAEHLQQLPGPLEVREVAPEKVENAWIADFRLRDGVADRQTPGIFVATIQYENGDGLARADVPVTLTVDGGTIATRTVDLQPGQRREVEFAPYQFDVAVDPGQPAFVTAEVSIPQDKLPADDQRFLVAPVVATLPVVFVDQWGKEQEDPQRNRYGETFHLRRLLAPLTNRAQRERQLIEVRHVTIDRLPDTAAGRELLEDARLVVIAGVSDPGTSVPLLREYVEQGGNLVIAAGGLFDPAAWTDAAWDGGLGILPAPLDPVTVGRLPDESTGTLEPFQLDYDSLANHEYFLLEGVSREEQEDLYRLPYFFKAVVANAGDEVKAAMDPVVTEQIEARRAALAELDGKLAELNQQTPGRKLTSRQEDQRKALQRERQKLKPSWLFWVRADESDLQQRPVEELVAETMPTVLARYTNGRPFMIERRLGRGRVLLVTTGVYSTWNTLSLTNTMLIYDRILRRMLRETLPERNISSQGQFVLPVAAAERMAEFVLTHPDGHEETLMIDALGSDRWGIRLSNLTRRGHYRVTALRTRNSSPPGDSAHEGLQPKLRVVPLAVNGPAEESQLVSAAELHRREQRGRTDSVESFQAAAVGVLKQAGLYGTGLWWWFMLAVLACLFVEMTVLAWPMLGRERTE